MEQSDHAGDQIPSGASNYSLLEALLHRRSRRFAKGMHLESGPLTYRSLQQPEPLSLDEEATLAFAACGITGHTLAELPYQRDPSGGSGGGNIMAQFVGRTVASGDALHTVTLFVINDDGVWMIKRPQDFPPADIPQLIQLARAGRLVELYDQSRVRVSEERPTLSGKVPVTLPVNKWSTNQPGTTCFLPVNELSALYINVLLTVFDHDYGYYFVDDRNHFRPPGIGRFARSLGGHLNDDPAMDLTGSVSFAETWLREFAALEQGGILQNLGLMTQAVGLGGFPYFAAHPSIWFETLGFRMEEPPVSRTHGVGQPMRILLKLLNEDIPDKTAVGLERGGRPLLKPYCPPYYDSMEQAVLAFVERKFDAEAGTLRYSGEDTVWRDGAAVKRQIPRHSDEAIAATIDYCEYIYNRYGRFPANGGPFRTILAYQAHHLDLDYYEAHFHEEALSPTQRTHPVHQSRQHS